MIRLCLLLNLLVAVPCLTAASSNEIVVGIIIDDDQPAMSTKIAGYVDDFLEYNTRVVTRSEFNARAHRFAATVDIRYSGQRGRDFLSIEILNNGSKSFYSTNVVYSSVAPQLVVRNRKAMDVAIYVLHKLSTDSWTGLVEVFKDPVDDLED